MARSFNSTSDYLGFPVSANSIMMPRTVGSISGWFKTGNAGTSRRVIYNEADSSTGQVNMFLAVNDGVAGDFRIFRRSSTGVTVSITHSGSYNDDQWHFFTYAWSSLTAHSLMIDGAEVATSTTNLTGTLTPINHQHVGRRSWGASSEGNFDGEISDIVLHAIALSLTEHQSLADKSKHALNATAISDVRSYFPFYIAKTGTNADIIDHIRQTDDSYTVSGTSSVDGPDGAGPTGMVAATDISKAFIFTDMSDSAIITRGTLDTDADRLLIELGNVVHDPTDATYPYKLYYSGSPSPYTGANTSSFVATASDPNGPWTKQGAIITNATLPTEDTYVYRDPTTGTYHLLAENKTGGNNAFGICYFTSSDGLIFTRQDSNGTPFLDNSASGWDNTDVSSPILWKEGETWYLLFEGRGTEPNNGEIGLATAPAVTGPWTKHASNPVLTRGTSGQWDDDAVVPDELVKIGSTYWLNYHASPGAGNWRQGLAYSTDLINWTRFALNPITRASTGNLNKLGGSEFGKMYTLTDVNGADDIRITTLYGDPRVQTSEWPPTADSTSSELISSACVGSGAHI